MKNNVSQIVLFREIISCENAADFFIMLHHTLYRDRRALYNVPICVQWVIGERMQADVVFDRKEKGESGKPAPPMQRLNPKTDKKIKPPSS